MRLCCAKTFPAPLAPNMFGSPVGKEEGEPPDPSDPPPPPCGSKPPTPTFGRLTTDTVTTQRSLRVSSCRTTTLSEQKGLLSLFPQRKGGEVRDLRLPPPF